MLFTSFPKDAKELIEYLKIYPILKVKFAYKSKNFCPNSDEDLYRYQGSTTDKGIVNALFSNDIGKLECVQLINIGYHTDGFFITNENKIDSTTYLYIEKKHWQGVSDLEKKLFEWDLIFDKLNYCRKLSKEQTNGI